MSRILAHPLRLDGTSIATVEDTDPDGVSQMVAVLMTTVLGERPLVPSFGVSDPTFTAGFDLAEVNAGLSLHGPDVRVTSLRTQWTDQATQQVVVGWQEVA